MEPPTAPRPDSSQLLTVREAAELLRLSTRAVYAAVARGDLPVVRIGRSIRIDPNALRPKARP